MNTIQPPRRVARLPFHARRGLRVAAAFLPLALTAAFMAGCAAKDQASEEVPTVTVQVGAAEKRPINREVRSEAILYPRDQAALIPRVAAPVAKFYVDRGSMVHANEVLAELDSRDLTYAAADSQASSEQAEVALQSAKQKAEQDLKVAKEQLDAAQKTYTNRQSLLEQGASSAKDVEDARIALTQAQNQYDTSQKQYDTKAAEAALASAKAKAAGAETQVGYSKIVSPINGVVTDRPVYPGEMPAAGSPVITVMDLSSVIARAHVSQQEAAQLKPGDPASIVTPGSAAVPGKVTLVSPALDPNSTTVEVWVQAANPGMKLRPGANVQVSMVSQTVANAVVIPAQSLLTDSDGVTSVITLDTDNKPHKQKVTVGIRNGNDIQVAKGLSGGERVVTVGAFELAKEDDDVLPKTKIQVQAPKMPDEDEDEDQ